MELNGYGIIRAVVVSGKSWRTFREQGKLTIDVERDANRTMIREAVEKAWDVRVAKVNVYNRPDRKGTFARRRFSRPGQKRAVITLKPGYKINLPGDANLESGIDAAQGGN